MKTIDFVKQNDGTIKLEYGEMQPRLPLCPRTVGHCFDTNRAWTHHVQLDEGYLFVKRAKGGSVAINLDHIVQMAIEAVPGITHPPMIEKHPKPDDLTVKAASRLPHTYQWESSEDGKNWVKVGGQASDSYSGPLAKKVRCVVTNAAGSTVSE